MDPDFQNKDGNHVDTDVALGDWNADPGMGMDIDMAFGGNTDCHFPPMIAVLTICCTRIDYVIDNMMPDSGRIHSSEVPFSLPLISQSSKIKLVGRNQVKVVVAPLVRHPSKPATLESTWVLRILWVVLSAAHFSPGTTPVMQALVHL
jgi:hypothetical protein